MSESKEFCPELGAGDSIHKSVMEFIQVVESKVVVCCEFGNCKDCFKKRGKR